MPARVRVWGLVVVALATCTAASPLATTSIPADLRSLVSAASAVALGRVAVVEPQLAPGSRAVERLVVVRVAEYYKGQLGGEVLLRVPGGEIGGYRTVMVGAPAFREGEDVVLFLRGDAPDRASLVGLAQGVVRVRVDGRTGRRTVWPPARPALTGARGRVVRGEGPPAAMALEEFAAEVRRLAGRRERPGRQR
jgi:hypothetical protein